MGASDNWIRSGPGSAGRCGRVRRPTPTPTRTSGRCYGARPAAPGWPDRSADHVLPVPGAAAQGRDPPHDRARDRVPDRRDEPAARLQGRQLRIPPTGRRPGNCSQAEPAGRQPAGSSPRTARNCTAPKLTPEVGLRVSEARELDLADIPAGRRKPPASCPARFGWGVLPDRTRGAIRRLRLDGLDMGNRKLTNRRPCPALGRPHRARPPRVAGLSAPPLARHRPSSPADQQVHSPGHRPSHRPGLPHPTASRPGRHTGTAPRRPPARRALVHRPDPPHLAEVFGPDEKTTIRYAALRPRSPGPPLLEPPIDDTP
jgi:hypothetical protein